MGFKRAYITKIEWLMLFPFSRQQRSELVGLKPTQIGLASTGAATTVAISAQLLK